MEAQEVGNIDPYSVDTIGHYEATQIDETLRRLWSHLITNASSTDAERLDAAKSLSRFHARRGNFPGAANALQGGLAMIRKTPEYRAELHFALAKLYSKHKGEHTWLAWEQTCKALIELGYTEVRLPQFERKVRRFRDKLNRKMSGGWSARVLLYFSGLSIATPGGYVPSPFA